jgi:hypothetical protein
VHVGALALLLMLQLPMLEFDFSRACRSDIRLSVEEQLEVTCRYRQGREMQSMSCFEHSQLIEWFFFQE